MFQSIGQQVADYRYSCLTLQSLKTVKECKRHNLEKDRETLEESEFSDNSKMRIENKLASRNLATREWDNYSVIQQQESEQD